MNYTICHSFTALMALEKEKLIDAINEDKWYLSEQANYDIGWCTAEAHFIETFLVDWAEKFRVDFCRNKCPDRHVCDLGKKLIKDIENKKNKNK